MLKRVVHFSNFRRLSAKLPMANSEQAYNTEGGGGGGRGGRRTYGRGDKRRGRGSPDYYNNDYRGGFGNQGEQRSDFGNFGGQRGGFGNHGGQRGGFGNHGGQRGGFGNHGEQRGGFGTQGEFRGGFGNHGEHSGGFGTHPHKLSDAHGQESMVAYSKGFPVAENSQGQEVLGGSSLNQWTRSKGGSGRDNEIGQCHDSDLRKEDISGAYQKHSEKGQSRGPSHENESRQQTQPDFSNSASERDQSRSHGEGNGQGPQPGAYPRGELESIKKTETTSSKDNSDRDSGIGPGKKNDPREWPQLGSCQGDSEKTSGMGQDQGNGSIQGTRSNSCQEEWGPGKNKGQSSRPHDHGNRAHGSRDQQHYGQDGGYNRQASYGSGYRGDNSDQQRRKRNRDDDEADVFLSKTLSFLLRHGAEKLKFKLMPGGFLYVDEILKNMKKLEGFTEEDVQRVVAQNDKQRFGLQKEEGTGRLKIRANQGHTVEVEDLELTPIKSADQVPMVLHGTYHDAWNSIKKQGLCRFKRNHIHFAAGEPGENGVISGMRSSCEVLIIIDLEKALKDGLKFFVSANNVILSPGNDEGCIYPCYFQAVLNRNPRYKLPFDPSIKGKTVPADQIANEFEKKDKRKKKKKNKKDKEDRKNNESGTPKEDIVGVGDTDLFDEKHKKEDGENNEVEMFQDALETTQDDVPEKWDLDSKVEQHNPVSEISKQAAETEDTQGDPEYEHSKGDAESKLGASGSETPNGTSESIPENRAPKLEVRKVSAKLDTKKGTADNEDAKPKVQKGSAKKSEATQGVQDCEASERTAESKSKQGVSVTETPKGAAKSEASNGTPESKPKDGASKSEITKVSAKLDTKKETAEKEDAKPKAQKVDAKQVLSAPTVEEEEEVKIEDEWEEIFITSVEDSISAVDYILDQKHPLSVVSIGDRLGDADGKIAVLVMTANGKSWFYQLGNSTVDFMEAGKLKQLFSDPKLIKVFHDVSWLSGVIFKQNEVVLDGTQVFDTKVVFQKGMLDNNDKDNLRLVGFMPARWTQEDSQVDCSKWTKSPLDKGLVDKLVERGKALLEFYKVFEQKKLKLPKKEIFEEVNKHVDMLKVQEMRKRFKKSQTSSIQAQDQSSSSSSSSQKKNKKKRRN